MKSIHRSKPTHVSLVLFALLFSFLPVQSYAFFGVSNTDFERAARRCNTEILTNNLDDFISVRFEGYKDQEEPSENILHLLTKGECWAPSIYQRIIDSQKLDLNEQNYQGKTPLYMAAEYITSHSLNEAAFKVAKLLLENGADVNAINDLYREGEITALFRAATRNDVELASFLLGYGAKTNIANEYGTTPLHLAVGTTRNSEPEEMVKLLLEHGANPNALHHDGATPLHWAAVNGYLNSSKLLVDYGADTQAKDSVGKSPAGLAMASGNLELFQLLSAAPTTSTKSTQKNTKSSKPNLVLFPLDVSESDEAFAQEYGVALQQGLSDRYTVFFGAEVERALEKEYSKLDCTVESCIQNVAITFNGELVADAAIKRTSSGALMKLQIKNIISGEVIEAKATPCRGCDELTIVDRLLRLGKGH
jgi:ankyrin repeat protein